MSTALLPPPRSRMIDVFLRYMKAEGAHVVFGIPGGLLHPFFEAVEADAEIELVVAKHEEGAAFMADGYARVGRRLAVCAGTSGPGSTNLLTGVSVAFADGIPMLVVTGQAPSYSLGKGAAQETPPEDIDIVSMFRPVTKYSTMITSPDRLAHHLRRALRLALTGRQGPVHLNVPVDFWHQEAEASDTWFDPSTYRPSTFYYDPLEVERATRLLLRAERPAMLVGSGVASSAAEEHVRELAELLPALVATSPRGKGLFPEDHRFSLGVMGFAGHPVAKDMLLGDRIDVLLAVGASLNETTTQNWDPRLRPREALIQIDIDVDRMGRTYPVDVPLVGDAQSILGEIIRQLHGRIAEGTTPTSKWRQTVGLPTEEEMYIDYDLRHSDARPIAPQRWRAELSDMLPDDAIVFSDIGGHMLFNIHHLRIRAGQRFVLNLGFGSMGHGTVAPIGAAMAEPGRPIVAIIGDACFTMNGMELLTATEYEVPVLWIVENNQMHGITWHGSKLLAGGKPMESIRYERPIEVAAIARAMGLNSWIVERPERLAAVFREALDFRRPSLIEIRVDGSLTPPLADRARTIAGFRDK